jgi:hypothetical protein
MNLGPAAKVPVPIEFGPVTATQLDVASALNLYSGGDPFKLRPSWLRFSWLSSVPSNKSSDTPYFTPRPLPSEFFPFIYHPTFAPMQSTYWIHRNNNNNNNNNIWIYIIYTDVIFKFREPGWRSQYSDWLRAGRPRSWSSNPGVDKNSVFPTSSKPVLLPTSCPKGTGEIALPGAKAAGEWSWLLTSN